MRSESRSIANAVVIIDDLEKAVGAVLLDAVHQFEDV